MSMEISKYILILEDFNITVPTMIIQSREKSVKIYTA